MASALLNCHLVTADEIHALISELRSFEQAQTTMICTPSIQQVIAHKLKN